jgi:hypothetical protein
MRFSPAIRRRLSTLVVSVIAPTFLFSGLPSVGCSCPTNTSFSVALGFLSGPHSYCGCASCPSKSNTGPCCCAPQNPVKLSQRNHASIKVNVPCKAVFQSGLLTVSANSAIDTDWVTIAREELPRLPVTDLRFTASDLEWNTGPPPIDLVVALRRFLI